MHIGVDFDNTIVSYDGVFHRVAVARGLVLPDVGSTKQDVRNDLLWREQDDVWTELQGYVYGVAIVDARPFSGVLDFFSRCRMRNIDVCIISHKTRVPVVGEQFDLHQSAWNWLNTHGFLGASRSGLSEGHIHFEETKQRKLGRIAEVGCTHFIDDLPEFLSAAQFPLDVKRILFDPHGRHQQPGVCRAGSWKEISDILGLG